VPRWNAIPQDVPLIVVIGVAKSAVAINQLVRQCASAWFDAGAWVVHLTGENDPDADTMKHPQYFPLPFYDNMLDNYLATIAAISRAGSSLTELAVTGTPASFLSPLRSRDHQTYNAAVFTAAGCGWRFPNGIDSLSC